MSSYCKFYKEKKQVSYDNGITWSDVVPAEYRKGELIQSGSADCESGPSGYSTQYLTFVAVSAGTFSFEGTSSSTIYNSTIQYSVDNGSTWYTLNSGYQSPTILPGDKIMWKGNLKSPGNGIGMFFSTKKFNVEGNIMSLLYGDNFASQTSLSGYTAAFADLFLGNENVVSAENLVLPATTLTEACYQSMFYSCSGLTTPPSILPSMDLSLRCYYQMFEHCPLLTSSPELPATTLVQQSYCMMFKDCPSLNYVKCLATDISASNSTSNWLDGVASSGTFVKNSSMSSWTSGTSGIPSNWSVQNA